MTVILERIRFRRDTAANWTTQNPTLKLGEPGFETDTGKIKIGDGVTAWTALVYRFEGSGGGGAWGSITGTLSAQTDLQDALDLKLNAAAVSAFGLTLIDDANAAAARTTLGLGTLATQSGTFSGTSSGTNTGDQTITLTGDVTGSGTGSFAATLATVNTDTGTFGGAATVPQISVNGKGLITGVTAIGIEAPWAGISGKPAAITSLSGTNTGDQTITLTGDATGSGTGSFAVTVGKINGVSLAGLATGILKNTTTTGTPSIAVAADFPTLNQNTTGSAATLTTSRDFSISGGGITASAVAFNGSGNVALSASVDAGHITLARMADIATARFIGRVTAATGVPESLTGTQATTLLDTFTSALKGLTPASGGGTANFLRADGTWAAPTASVAWGGITGTLSNQTDLNTALAAKAPLASPTFTGTVTINTKQIIGFDSGGSALAVGGSGSGVATIQAQNVPNGGNVLSFALGGTVGNTVDLIAASASNTGSLQTVLQQNGTGAAAQQIWSLGGGDAYTNYANATLNWCQGIDTSDGNKYKIVNQTSPSGAADALVFSPTSLDGVFGGKVTTLASAAAKAGFRLPHGSAPTTPDNGDLWTTTAGLYARINGATVGPYGTGGSGGVSDGDKGDITVSASGATWTIDNAAVTLAKMADMATGSLIYRKTAGAGAPEVNTLATLKTDLGLTGTNSGDQTITLTGNVTGSGTGSFATTVASIPSAATGVTQTAGNNSTQIATTAYVRQALPIATYRSLLDCTASHTAARAAGTYWLGQGQPAGVTGTGTLYAPNVIYIDPADYPSVDGVAAKLRLRVGLMVNDVAPTGNYTFGLYPVTRPATSGAAGLSIITMGTVVSGSTVAVTAPAADSANNMVGTDFAVPAAGWYVLGFVSTAAVAASSHLHISALLQQRNA